MPHPAAQVRMLMKRLADIPPKQEILIDSARRSVETILSNDRLSGEGRTAMLQERREDFNRDSESFTAQADKLLDQIEEHERLALSEPPASTGSVEDRLLTEMRADRFWTGARRELDASQDPFNAAGPMLIEAGIDARRTLMEELPAYLRANGHSRTAIESMITQAVAEADPALGEVRTLAAQAHRYTGDSIKWNARLLTRTMDNPVATQGMPVIMWPAD